MRAVFSLNRRTISFFANYHFTVFCPHLRNFSDTGEGKNENNHANDTIKSEEINDNDEKPEEIDDNDEKTEEIDDNGEKSDSWHMPVETILGSPSQSSNPNEFEGSSQYSNPNDFEEPSYKRPCREETLSQAQKIFKILQQDGPGFNARLVLDEMQPQISNSLVREVLFRVLVSINCVNKSRCAKIAYKFFSWSSQQNNYSHNSSIYNLTMKIFAECEELKAMWRLLEEMLRNGLPVTARTFNILICSCYEAGMGRKLVEKFIMAKTFNYRPFKHSFNAILHSLLALNQYRLIEWVYQKMLLEGHKPDILSYNIIMRSKYMLGKLDQFHRLLDEMGRNGFEPDLHTYNLLLHVLGKGDKPLAALNLLNYMSEVGFEPNVLHFTNLIDGLSRAGNLDACKYFFDEMIKKGMVPDVVCYTVMITSYSLAGQFEDAHNLFDEMLVMGNLPNVYTYNTMIKGFCNMGKFKEASSLLREMDSRGCVPNFAVYSNLVRRLRNNGKISEANDVVNYMVERGHYLHLASRFKCYRKK